MTGLIIDIVIVALLGGAIGFGLVLDRRVKRLMQALAELQPAVDQFARAVDRSEDSVHALRGASAQAAEAGRSETGGRRGAGVPNLRSLRNQAARSVRSGGAGVAKVEGKSDLVRSFFEAAGKRQA
ncbi:hypothetical protein [Roseivivax sp. CAU 1761]